MAIIKKNRTNPRNTPLPVSRHNIPIIAAEDRMNTGIQNPAKAPPCKKTNNKDRIFIIIVPQKRVAAMVFFFLFEIMPCS